MQAMADEGDALNATTLAEANPTDHVVDGVTTDSVAVDLLVSVFAFSMAIVLALVVLTAYRAVKTRALLNNQEGAKMDLEANLPSYTLVSGLPTYDEALDQLQRRRELRRSSSAQRAIEAALAAARAAGNLITVRRLQTLRQLSVGDLIQYTFRSNSFDKS